MPSPLHPFERLRRAFLIYRMLMKDARTPFASKALPWVAVAYFLSPIDLIPDFIPVLGLLDDVLIVPFLLYLAYHLIPWDLRKQKDRDNIDV